MSTPMPLPRSLPESQGIPSQAVLSFFPDDAPGTVSANLAALKVRFTDGELVVDPEINVSFRPTKLPQVRGGRKLGS